MFLSVELNFRRPIYPWFYSFAKIFQTLSRDFTCVWADEVAVGTKVVPIVHTTGNVRAAWRLNKFRTDTPAALKRRSGSL
jgi:hypothetical protein